MFVTLIMSQLLIGWLNETRNMWLRNVTCIRSMRNARLWYGVCVWRLHWCACCCCSWQRALC